MKDAAGEAVEGSFYTEQLQHTNQQIYRIDRVIRRRRNRDGTRDMYVSWCGYGRRFNQWISDTDLARSGVVPTEH